MDRIWIGLAFCALLQALPARAQFGPGPVGPGFGGRGVVVGGFFGPPIGGGFFAPPFGGRFRAGAAVIVAPPIVVQQPIIIQQVIVPPILDDPDDAPRLPDLEKFIVIRPDRPNNQVPPAQAGKPRQPPVQAAIPKPPPAQANPAPQAPKQAAAPKPPAKQARPVEIVQPAPLPLAPGRAANPRVEADQQIEMGRTAFAIGEYGRTLDCFRRAIAAVPNDSASYFLLAQAQFAIGKYDNAVASIADGLKLRPDWPQSRFQSRDLYRNNPLTFEAHLKDLRDAAADNPDDPRLLFLLGVQLWFDDQRDAARPLFEQAVRLVKDPGLIEAFLKK